MVGLGLVERGEDGPRKHELHRGAEQLSQDVFLAGCGRGGDLEAVGRDLAWGAGQGWGGREHGCEREEVLLREPWEGDVAMGGSQLGVEHLKVSIPPLNLKFGGRCVAVGGQGLGELVGRGDKEWGRGKKKKSQETGKGVAVERGVIPTP